MNIKIYNYKIILGNKIFWFGSKTDLLVFVLDPESKQYNNGQPIDMSKALEIIDTINID